MNKRKLCRSVGLALGLTWPFCALGLGLGDIDIRSGLNQVLVAEIPILSVGAKAPEHLGVRLAPEEYYTRAGISRHPMLADLRFRPTVNEQGNVVIRVSSTRPVREPILNFLLEINQGSTRLVREYTVLLDPVHDRSQSPATPVPGRQSGVWRLAPQTPPSAHGSSYGPVKRGETLSALGFRLRPDKGVAGVQMALALYRANPHAFAKGDMDSLLAGAHLDIPSREFALETPYREALKIFRRGGRIPFAAASDGSAAQAPGEVLETLAGGEALEEGFRLRLLSAEGDGQPLADETQPRAPLPPVPDREIPNLVARLRQEIEAVRTENQRLKARLEQAEQRMADLKAESAERDKALGNLQDALSGSVQGDNQRAEPRGTAQHPLTPKTAETKTTANTGSAPVPPPMPSSESPARSRGNRGGVFGYLALGLLLLGLAGALARLLLGRSRHGWRALQDERTERLRRASRSGAPRPAPQPAPWAMPGAFDNSLSGADPPGSPAGTRDQVAHILSEADLCLTYGQYEFAEALLADLVDVHPDVAEYRLRMLRVLHAARKEGPFLAHARELRRLTGNDGGELWAEAAGLGRELWPQEPMFRPGFLDGHDTDQAVALEAKPPAARDRDPGVATREQGQQDTAPALLTEDPDADVSEHYSGLAAPNEEDERAGVVPPPDQDADGADGRSEDLRALAGELLDWEQNEPEPDQGTDDKASMADPAILDKLGRRH